MNETFVASIVVALFSLFGVLRSIRLSQKQHEDRLIEERKKIREEKEFSAKQAAIMNASQAIVKFVNYFVTWPDKESAIGVTAPEIVELGVALNNLHFYCDLETIEQSTKLGQKLNEAFIEATTAKLTSMFLGGDIQALETKIKSYNRAIESSHAEILVLLQSDSKNPLISTHRELIANNHKEISVLHSKTIELLKAKYFATEQCRDVVKKHLKTIYGAAQEVLLLARKELCFAIDEGRYRALMTQRNEAVIASIETAFAEIRKKAEEKFAKVNPHET